jgi:hypothetical protein
MHMPTTLHRARVAVLAAAAALSLAAPAAHAQSATSSLYSGRAVMDYCGPAQQLTASSTLTPVVMNHNQVGSFLVSSSAPYEGPNLSAYNAKGDTGGQLPLTVQQYVMYSTTTAGWQFPQVIACKMKDAEGIQFHFGATAAGAQRQCRDVNEQAVAAVYANLTSLERRLIRYQQNTVVFDPDSVTEAGPSRVGGIPNVRPGLVYLGNDGLLHIRSKQNFVARTNPSLAAGPDKKGSFYCHFPAPEYVRNVVLGQFPPCNSISAIAPDLCITP